MVKAKEKVKIAEAKLRVFVNDDSLTYPRSAANSDTVDRNFRKDPLNVIMNHSTSNDDLISVLKENMLLNRLPAPEPPIFSGDPLQNSELITAFRILIENECSAQAEKLFNLKQSGAAAGVIRGTFLRSDSRTFDDAMRRLTNRYGDEFFIQRAFREKFPIGLGSGKRMENHCRTLPIF